MNPLIQLSNGYSYVGTYPATIPPYTESGGVKTVDGSKFCWVGGILGTGIVPNMDIHRALTPVDFGYANSNDPNDPNFDTRTVISHICVWDAKRDSWSVIGYRYAYETFTGYIGDPANYTEGYRICKASTTYPALGQSLVNPPFDLEPDYYFGWGSGSKTILADGSCQKIHAQINSSIMASDTQVIDWMEAGYVYPWVSVASYFDDPSDLYPDDYSAAWIITTGYDSVSDEYVPCVDWGWISMDAAFGNKTRVATNNSWNNVQNMRVNIGNSWIPVVNAKVNVNGTWQEIPHTSSAALY